MTTPDSILAGTSEQRSTKRPADGDEAAAFAHLRGLPQILLASGQTLPNVLAMRELDSRGYVILHTADVPPDRLKAVCQSFGYEELSGPVLVDAHDDRLTEQTVRAAFTSLTEKFPGQHWVANLTGSTKLTVLGTARALGVPDANLPGLAGAIYYEKGIFALMPGWSRVARQPITRLLTVEEALRANGILPVSQRTIPGAFTFSLGRVPSAEDIKAARTIVKDKDRFDVIGDLRQGQSGLSPASVDTLSARYALESHGTGYLGTKPSTYFNGLWLECLLYDVLSRAKEELSIDDVQMGVVLHRSNATQEPDTDLDVCFTRRNVLHFISCKTDKIEKMMDEVYEVAVRRLQAGGTFGAGGLIHWCEPELLGRDKRAMVVRSQKIASQLKIGLLLGDALESKRALVEAVRVGLFGEKPEAKTGT